VQALAELIERLGFTVEPAEPRPGKPNTLDIVVSEV
jgi:hypothetical protein